MSIGKIVEKMESAGLPRIAIDAFVYYYQQLVAGEQGLLSKKEIRPLTSVPELESLPNLEKEGTRALQKAVVLKLNGGLGTSMGMTKAKSLLRVKDDMTFLDIIAQQVLHFRNKHGCNLPLVFMNSFNTRDDTLAYLRRYEGLGGDIPLDFLQHKVPKIRQDNLEPVTWEENADQEWCPPGHGDIYTALVTSGLLEMMLGKGYEFMFMSNGDNLGAVMDLQILGYFADQGLPFMSEVTTRTEADKKGGHLAQLGDGQLILRETAQCPEEEREEFEDVSTYKYFNCNNLWVNLKALAALMKEKNNVPGLTMIKNSKTVDPRDKESPTVFQLETAMGSAISVFKGSQGLLVPRSRFAPVKKCSDLLGVWSDAYVLTEDYQIVDNPERKTGPVVVLLDDAFYKLIDDMQERFPEGAPSLKECESLKVEGDVKFGKGVKVKGKVVIRNPKKEQMVVEDGSDICQDVVFE